MLSNGIDSMTSDEEEAVFVFIVSRDGHPYRAGNIEKHCNKQNGNVTWLYRPRDLNEARLITGHGSLEGFLDDLRVRARVKESAPRQSPNLPLHRRLIGRWRNLVDGLSA